MLKKITLKDLERTSKKIEEMSIIKIFDPNIQDENEYEMYFEIGDVFTQKFIKF